MHAGVPPSHQISAYNLCVIRKRKNKQTRELCAMHKHKHKIKIAFWMWICNYINCTHGKCRDAGTRAQNKKYKSNRNTLCIVSYRLVNMHLDIFLCVTVSGTDPEILTHSPVVCTMHIVFICFSSSLLIEKQQFCM